MLLFLFSCASGECPSGYIWDNSAGQCFQRDDDGDGWGSIYDCDDANAAVNPAATESCDGVDNDCNGLIDDDDGNVRADQVFYADVDGDGFGGSAFTVQACVQPEGYYASADDCNDVDASVYPDAIELCDDADNDCDGEIDNDAICTEDFYGDITITSAQGAAAFCENYSGTVYGTVTIAGSSMEDLSHVACIQQVYGSLVIDLPLAVELALDDLTLVDGDVWVYLTEDGTSVRFPALAHAGVIGLWGGDNLTEIDLSSLETALGLTLYYMPLLESVSLPALTSLSDFYSAYNDSLSQIDWPLLETLGDAEFYYLPMLESVDLSSATSIGDLTFRQNELLSSIDVSSALEIGQITLYQNDEIQSLDLDSATSLGGLVLEYNDSLETVTWAGIDRVGGDVIFRGNSQLELPDHSNIVQVDGDWGLYNSNVQTLDDLGNLEALLGDLILVDNGLQTVDLSSLTQLGGVYISSEDIGSLDLSGLEAPLTGSFYLAYNYDLMDFGWPEFGDLDGDFVWEYNGPTSAIEASSLTSVSGRLTINDASWGSIEEVELDNLESVGSTLYISYLDAVDRLDLGRLEEVGSSLQIYYSDYVEELDLGALISVGGSLYLYDVGRYADDFDLDLERLEEVGSSMTITYLSYYGDSSQVDIHLDSLEKVGNSFNIEQVNGQNGGAVDIQAPSLKTIGGSMGIYYNGRATQQGYLAGDVSIEMPALETVGGGVTVYYNGYGQYTENNASGDVDVDLSSLRSANGTLNIRYNGYCYSGSSSWHCRAGDVEVDLSRLESVGNGSVYLEANGYASYGEGGDLSADLSSLTGINGNLYVQENGQARNYYNYTGEYPTPGNIDVRFTDLETVTGYLYLSRNSYGYDYYYGNRYYSDWEVDFTSLREVYYLYLYENGIPNFDDWGSLETISSQLYLQYNYRLTNVDGLKGGDYADYMYIYGNSSLGNSAAYDLIDSWSTVNGYNVSNN